MIFLHNTICEYKLPRKNCLSNNKHVLEKKLFAKSFESIILQSSFFFFFYKWQNFFLIVVFLPGHSGIASSRVRNFHKVDLNPWPLGHENPANTRMAAPILLSQTFNFNFKRKKCCSISLIRKSLKKVFRLRLWSRLSEMISKRGRPFSFSFSWPTSDKIYRWPKTTADGQKCLQMLNHY